MHAEPFILGDTRAHTSLGFCAVSGALQAKGRVFMAMLSTGTYAAGLYTEEGELSFQDIVEEGQRNKMEEQFCSRCFLALVADVSWLWQVDATRN